MAETNLDEWTKLGVGVEVMTNVGPMPIATLAELIRQEEVKQGRQGTVS